MVRIAVEDGRQEVLRLSDLARLQYAHRLAKSKRLNSKMLLAR